MNLGVTSSSPLNPSLKPTQGKKKTKPRKGPSLDPSYPRKKMRLTAVHPPDLVSLGFITNQ